MTRREWLKQNPPPAAAGALLTTLAELKAEAPQVPQAIATRDALVAKLEAQIAACVHCSTHKLPLVRHAYRPEDLFTCPTGPHFFIWTKNGTAAALLPCDLTKPLPGIDDKMDW